MRNHSIGLATSVVLLAPMVAEGRQCLSDAIVDSQTIHAGATYLWELGGSGQWKIDAATVRRWANARADVNYSGSCAGVPQGCCPIATCTNVTDTEVVPVTVENLFNNTIDLSLNTDVGVCHGTNYWAKQSGCVSADNNYATGAVFSGWNANPYRSGTYDSNGLYGPFSHTGYVAINACESVDLTISSETGGAYSVTFNDWRADINGNLSYCGQSQQWKVADAAFQANHALYERYGVSCEEFPAGWRTWTVLQERFWIKVTISSNAIASPVVIQGVATVGDGRVSLKGPLYTGVTPSNTQSNWFCGGQDRGDVLNGTANLYKPTRTLNLGQATLVEIDRCVRTVTVLNIGELDDLDPIDVRDRNIVEDLEGVNIDMDDAGLFHPAADFDDDGDIDETDLLLFDDTYCVVDLNGDGQVNTFDYMLFQTYYSEEDPRADFNGDGQINIFDYLTYDSMYNEGCD